MSGFEPRNPDYRDHVSAIFDAAPFIRVLGATLQSVAPGMCETALELRPDHLQQNGFVHAGVQATLADHTAGCAAATLMAADMAVLTAEFKINLLRAASGTRLCCCARVLRPGSSLTVAESELFAEDGERRALVSKALVTLTFVPAASLRQE
ncbi:MAG: PaaI family thioesterase [Alphaproteobacteria bacterium]|nr:MAG: PaaI family thioesterase [Alphaproteobacteria bacterium]